MTIADGSAADCGCIGWCIVGVLQMAELTDPDLILQQLTKLQGVKDYVVLNRIGIPIKYNVDMSEARAIKISGLVSELVKSSREFLLKRYDGPAGQHATNEPADVSVLRLRTKKNEIIIAPGTNRTEPRQQQCSRQAVRLVLTDYGGGGGGDGMM